MKNQTKIIALVGMPGSGKSIAAEELTRAGCAYVRFGQLTIDTLKERNLPITPENERAVREELRHTHGMGAYATLNIPTFDRLLASNHVVADGLYSWSEYKIMKTRYGARLAIIAISTSPKTRYERLVARAFDATDTAVKMRPLTAVQAQERDYAEIEHIEKGGPIAMADYTLVNENISEDELRAHVRTLFTHLIAP